LLIALKVLALAEVAEEHVKYLDTPFAASGAAFAWLSCVDHAFECV
jgi:hypothetical protein